MWLFNSKPGKDDCEMVEQTIYDAIASGAKTTKNDDPSRKRIFDALKDRVNGVNTISTKLETLNDELKQNVFQHDFIVNTVHNMDYGKSSSECGNSENTTSKFENNENCNRIENVLKCIPVLEKRLQTLTAQV